MDSKKVIDQLVKIAEKQQKIINKLAQQVAPHTANPDPPAAHLEPNHINKDDAGTLMAALGGLGGVALLKTSGDKMIVTFKPGQKTQANYDLVNKKLSELMNANKIQMTYQLEAA